MLRHAWKALVLVGIALGLAYHLFGIPPVLRPQGFYYHVDLDVYRLGGMAFMRGWDIYGQLPTLWSGKNLPFTYPPAAAVAFGPMSWVSLETAGTVMTVMSILALLAVVALTLQSAGMPVPTALWGAGAVVAVAFTFEPFYSTLNYGQINLVLALLVAADLMPRKTPWPRGLLIGFAVALKLTPAIFVLLLLVRRDFRAVVMTGVGFLIASGTAFLLAPADSWHYWTTIIFDSGRIGGASYASNQSLTGMIARLGAEHAQTAIWGTAVLAVLALTVLVLKRCLDAGQTALAVSANGLAGLLISPVSWSHHWVWAVPALVALAVLAYRRRSLALAVWVALGVTIFVAAPHWRVAGDLEGSYVQGRDWPLTDQLLGSSYVLWGLGTLIVVALALRSRVRSDEVRVPVPAAA